MKKTYKLLVYEAIGYRYGRKIMAVLVITIFLVAGSQRIEFLSDMLLYSIIIALVVAAVGVYFRVWMPNSAIHFEKEGLRLQGPLSSIVIPYQHIRSAIPTRLNDHFSPEDLSTAQLEEYRRFINDPVLFLALGQDELPDRSRRRWFSSLLFSNQKNGLVLILDDWVSFARTLEKIRRGTEKKRRLPKKKVAVPEQPADFEQETRQGEVVGQPGNPLLLVADENQARIKTYKRMLIDSYQLLFAGDGPEALRTAREFRPDVILVDHYLDRLDGLQVVVSLRRSSQFENTPVLFLTDGVCPEAFQAGADDVISRPLQQEDLRARLTHQLRQNDKINELVLAADQLKSESLNQMAELVRRGELINFLPEAVARSILSGHLINPWANHQRQKVTVLFVDLVGFTMLTGRLNPELLSELINEFLREMTAVTLANHGTVDKFIGDEVMVLFGAPEGQPEKVQARHAAQTAVEMLYAVHQMSLRWAPRLPQTLDVRIGFNTGFGTTGIFGDELLRSYTVVGSVVNIAARLRAAAEPGQIVCSAESYALLKDIYQADPLGSLSLKGLDKPVEAFSLAKGIFQEAGNLAPK